MNSDLDLILPLVARPCRYTGGELNARAAELQALSFKPQAHEVRACLVMPDVYEIGMSNYGLRILYHVLNRRPGTICERAFTPWPDMAEKLKSTGTRLFSLESRRPLGEFDILGFSLQSELSYTNVLYTLDLAGVPLHSDRRSAKDPLVVCGGPCCVNPLPTSPFVDAFVIGDGEEAIGEIVAVYQDWDHANRDSLLSALAGLEGVYVPGKQGPHPRPLSQWERGEGVRTLARRRTVTSLREADFPLPPVLPICEIVHDRLTLEIARGCCRGCRFCQAGIINRPYRSRPVDEIVRLAEQGIRSSGWDEVSLLSLSTLDYPELIDLITRLNSTLEKRRVSISLPSVRGEDFTPELAAALKQVKKTGLTFAPETASPRLRALVNKDISEERILNSVRNAVEAGWHSVKLYFMLGLPGETSDDVAEIARFVNEVGRVGRGLEIRFNLSPFVPKPHTPLQWEGFEAVETLKEKIGLARAGLRKRSFKAKWEEPDVACIQAVLARGDERLSAVIERVFRAGGVFQEWTEKFSRAVWDQAFAEAGLAMDDYLRPIPGEAPLPWDFIDVGVSKEFLRAERTKAYNGELTPDCRVNGCVDCGLSRAECGMTCREAGAGVSAPVLGPQSPVPASEPPDYGRYRRKIVAAEQFRTRFRLKYAVGESFRYAGHLDVVRAFYRTLRRSEIPVAYTLGFSPRPVIAFGPPRPVGLTSSGEYLDLQTEGHYPGNLIMSLGPALPPGLRLLDARPIMRKVQSLGAALNAARYEVEVAGLSESDLELARDRSRNIPAVLRLGFSEGDQHSHRFTQIATDSDSRYPCSSGPSAVSRQPSAVFDLTMSLAPGVKLFNVLQEVFGRDEPTVRTWRIERKDCYIGQWSVAGSQRTVGTPGTNPEPSATGPEPPVPGPQPDLLLISPMEDL